MLVKFNSVEGFCEELKKDAGAVDRRIVRCTNLFEASKLSVNIRHVTFIASYSIQGQIVELKRYCGDLWEINKEAGKKVADRADECRKIVEEACQSLGLEVRAGHLTKACRERKRD